jgi:hypothetical protein
MRALSIIALVLALPRLAAADEPAFRATAALTGLDPSALATASEPEPEPEPEPFIAAAPRPTYKLTDTLLVSGLGFAAGHMVDNILSRRTFASQTIPETLVQALYVGAGVAYQQEAGPLVWILFSTGLVTAHSFGHWFVPSAGGHVSTFHEVWSEGDNRLDLQSGAAGRVSQGILLGLDLSFSGVLVSSIRDGLRCGFTLRRTRCMDR